MEVLRSFEDYDFSGIGAILSVSPYYNRPSQRGIFQHYRMIASESPVPVVAYNVPSRTGSNIEAQTTLELAQEVDNLIGIKEASGSLERVMKTSFNDVLKIHQDHKVNMRTAANMLGFREFVGELRS